MNSLYVKMVMMLAKRLIYQKSLKCGTDQSFYSLFMIK